jgi:hypothetical protein
MNPAHNELYRMSQGEYCIDYHVEAHNLVLYACDDSDKENQQWVLQRRPTWNFDHVFTPAGAGACIAVTGANGAKPVKGASIMVTDCDDGQSDYMKWGYDPMQRMLHLTTWPDMCLDFAEADNQFIIWECTRGQVLGLDTGTSYNQQILFEFLPYKHDTTPMTPSVNPVVGTTYLFTMGNYCLDYDTSKSSLGLYNCHGAVNQEWGWKKTSTGYQIFSPANGGKCVRVDGGSGGAKPAEGAKITFSDCASGDTYESWHYSFKSKRFIMAQWSDLCLDYSAGGMFSSGSFVVYGCKVESGHGEAENEIIHVKDVAFNPVGVSHYSSVMGSPSPVGYFLRFPQAWSPLYSPTASTVTFALAFFLGLPLAVYAVVRRRRASRFAVVEENDDILLATESECHS